MDEGQAIKSAIALSEASPSRGNGVTNCLGMEMIGRRSHLKQSLGTNTGKTSPLFFVWMGRSRLTPAIHYHRSALPYYPIYRRTLSNMNTLPSESGGTNLTRDPCQYGISHTRTNNSTTNNVRGSSNTNFANVSNSYNHTINVGVSGESTIQAWLSPLEPHARHQDVRNRRLDGVGEWVLQKDEFKSWRESQDSSMNPNILCYGDQGAGKTYIRYKNIFQGLQTMLTMN